MITFTCSEITEASFPSRPVVREFVPDVLEMFNLLKEEESIQFPTEGDHSELINAIVAVEGLTYQLMTCRDDTKMLMQMADILQRRYMGRETEFLGAIENDTEKEKFRRAFRSFHRKFIQHTE